MRRLRSVVLLFALLQLSRAESVEEPRMPANAEGDEDLSTWDEAETKETIDARVEDEVEPEQLDDQDEDPPYERKLPPRERLAMEEEERWQRTLEEVERRERGSDEENHPPYEHAEEEDMESTELTEAPYERKMSPRERLALEEEERWQRTLEEVERREREEVLQASESTLDVDVSELGQTDYSEGQYEQEINENNYPQGEDDGNGAYLERQRSLNEQGSQAVDGNEDEEEALPVIPGLTDVELVAFNAEYANAEVLDKIIDWSYDQVADMSRYRDNYIHVEDLYQFLLKTLNPLDEEIDTDDEQTLIDAVSELRRQQGLVDDEQILYRGFIARGMPLRFLQSLAHEMHQTVQTRRLQARDEL
ncbi:hypothetical protein PI124_g7176 [Phytophthora idaei]|nr:hypothetical protein PI125_g5084 [Phytophthora idaei]KAG3165233.1 hypothetical protein PI126_g4741 [Phytophthora idaei]KAG3248152.1 hypothetical protein PI124_g7176 [Phytophthora idaei]